MVKIINTTTSFGKDKGKEEVAAKLRTPPRHGENNAKIK